MASSRPPTAESADRAKAQLYEEIELAVLRRMKEQLEDPDCPAQVLAAAVSMLRAGGVQARGANAGAVGSDEKAVAAWLASLPPEKAADLAQRAAANRGGGREMNARRRAAREAASAAESAPAAA